MVVYRTSMQIVADLLVATDQCGQEGIKTTSLLSKANLSHSRLEKFVSNLLKVYMKYSKGLKYVNDYNTE